MDKVTIDNLYAAFCMANALITYRNIQTNGAQNNDIADAGRWISIAAMNAHDNTEKVIPELQALHSEVAGQGHIDNRMISTLEETLATWIDDVVKKLSDPNSDEDMQVMCVGFLERMKAKDVISAIGKIGPKEASAVISAIQKYDTEFYNNELLPDKVFQETIKKVLAHQSLPPIPQDRKPQQPTAKQMPPLPGTKRNKKSGVKLPPIDEAKKRATTHSNIQLELPQEPPKVPKNRSSKKAKPLPAIPSATQDTKRKPLPPIPTNAEQPRPPARGKTASEAQQPAHRGRRYTKK